MKIFKTRSFAKMFLSGNKSGNRNYQTNGMTIFDEETQWTFGQILPVLLLLAPLFVTVSLFASRAAKNPPTCRHFSSGDQNEFSPTDSTTDLCQTPNHTPNHIHASPGDVISTHESSNPSFESQEELRYPFTASNPTLAKAFKPSYFKQQRWISVLLLCTHMSILYLTGLILGSTQVLAGVNHTPLGFLLGFNGEYGYLWPFFTGIFSGCAFLIAVQLLFYSQLADFSSSPWWLAIAFCLEFLVEYLMNAIGSDPSILFGSSITLPLLKYFVNAAICPFILYGIYLVVGLITECWVIWKRCRHKKTAGHGV